MLIFIKNSFNQKYKKWKNKNRIISFQKWWTE
jgi:hypothetical protein